jgi:hypothetical protein
LSENVNKSTCSCHSKVAFKSKSKCKFVAIGCTLALSMMFKPQIQKPKNKNPKPLKKINKFQMLCKLSFIQKTSTMQWFSNSFAIWILLENLDYFQCWNGDGPNLSNLNCQVGQEGEYEVFGTYWITIQMGFHRVVITIYTPTYPTWAPHCYALLVTIFLLIMFSYDYQ